MFFFIMSSRLEELVASIVADTSEKKLSQISFLYHGDDVCLQWKTYMFPLVHKYGELTSFMLEWVRAWLNLQLEDIKCHMTVPYIPTLLMQSVEEARRDSVEVFVDFIHNMYGELPDLDITTIMVPFTCRKH